MAKPIHRTSSEATPWSPLAVVLALTTAVMILAILVHFILSIAAA